MDPSSLNYREVEKVVQCEGGGYLRHPIWFLLVDCTITVKRLNMAGTERYIIHREHQIAR